jgi:drug/metabolite transporter (DMT)-like permease
MRQFLPGLLFAALWSSASVATKFGVAVAHPLVLANVRFFIAGFVMLVFAYAIRRQHNRLPRGKEWKQLVIFSFLNTTVYLGAYVIALKHVSAGIGSLSTATNPLFIIILSAIWLKRKLRMLEVAGLIIGLTGVVIASYPLLQTSHASVEGLVILFAAMISVSAATVYYAGITWQLENVVINGWQVLIGGLLLLPFTLINGGIASTHFNKQFWGSVLWLVIPVSIAALQLWFYLVKQDAVKASLWLFLCPIFGFIYAAIILHEPITWHTYAGTMLVIAGLYLAQREKLTGNSGSAEKVKYITE